jgi:hypothetical protein
VHEWCLDNYYYLPGGHVIDPRRLGEIVGHDFKEHIIKGGSWLDIAKNCRTEDRHSDRFSLESGHVGFRIVCVPIEGAL